MMTEPDSGMTPGAMPVMRWDHRPEAQEWTEATLQALAVEGAVLASTIPADIAEFCPTYVEADPQGRRAFWAGLFSAIAKYESTWNPAAVGGGGRYFGLLQISPATADWVGCDLSDGGLTNGETNLECAVRIAANRAPDQGGPVQGRGPLAGLVNDWGPMHDPDKVAEMAAWTRTQPYCVGN
jgi:hypothetical protein